MRRRVDFASQPRVASRAPQARWCPCARRSPSGWAIERWRSRTGCRSGSSSSTSAATRSRFPNPVTSKAWTAVEHQGNRVAAIIHDAELQARPELVEAAAAGAVLALDNERLKADLNARLEDLRASRRRIVEANGRGPPAAGARPARWRPAALVSLSLDLQLLRAECPGSRRIELLDETDWRRSAKRRRNCASWPADPPADAHRPRAGPGARCRSPSDPRSGRARSRADRTGSRSR